MKMTCFDKPMMRAAMLALCTATLSAAPMMMAQDNTAAPPPPQHRTHGAGRRTWRADEGADGRLRC